MVAILVTLFAADHPRLFSSHRSQTVTLDRAYPDEQAAIAHLETLLNAEVTRLRIKKLDLVSDTTIVDVCFKMRRDLASGHTPSGHPEFAEMAPRPR